MAQSALPYPSNPSLEQLKVLAADSVIYLAPSPTGSDGTGDGSLAKPYLTLQKCMDVARTYTIVGSATLYIRFLRGEYTITQNVDLYHPQGGNLIIEGDPSAFQQRCVWQVENYTWNLENFAGGGHTGSIRLFDGVTSNANGCTMHGFTGQDQGMYFSITNAHTGSRNGYVSASGLGINGNNPDNQGPGYSTVFAGDRFFNHGYSFEDAEGILGIGRILGATTSDTKLDVQFQNLNIDTRCPGLTFGAGNAGINNTITWGGINSNYPEPQYSQPNGYYGWAGTAPWKNDAGTVTYPSNPGVSHNTVDPYILSTYPVVIRSSYNSNTGSLFLKNGTLKALRNIFFANNQEPFVSSNGATGATLNFSQGISAVVTNSVSRISGVAGTGLYLENANMGIRHLGFYGIGNALSLYNSKVYSYFDKSGNTGTNSGINSVYGTINYAVQNTLDNAPVICTTQVNQGIVASNSVIDFTTGSALNRQNGIDYRMHTSHISASQQGIYLQSTQMTATSLAINTTADAPKVYTEIVLPIFPGMDTVAGATAHLPAYGTLWQRYPVAKMFMQPAGGSEVEIAYINWAINGGVSTSTTIAGSTSSATLVGTNQASAYNRYYIYGIKTAPHGLSYMTTQDIQLGITAGSGGTFTMRFYNNRNLSGVSASFTIGKNSVLLAGANGQTVGYVGMGGESAAPYMLVSRSFGGMLNDTYGNYSSGSIKVHDGSSAIIQKSLVICNGGYSPVDVRRNSSLLVGDSRVGSSVTPGYADLYYGVSDRGNSEITPVYGNLSITGFNGKAIRVSENSNATIGSLFAKHPLHADGSVGLPFSATPVVLVDKVSSASFGRVYAVTHPAGKLVSDAATPLWSTITLTKYGSHQNNLPTESMMRAESGSRIFLAGISGGGGSMFAFDGGTADMRVGQFTPHSYIFASVSASVVVSEGSEAYNTTSAAVPGACRTISDTRTTAQAQKIMTRSPSTASERYLYGAPTLRTWLGDQSGANHNYAASHTNVSASGQVGVPGNPNPGGTMSIYIAKNGIASN